MYPNPLSQVIEHWMEGQLARACAPDDATVVSVASSPEPAVAIVALWGVPAVLLAVGVSGRDPADEREQDERDRAEQEKTAEGGLGGEA